MTNSYEKSTNVTEPWGQERQLSQKVEASKRMNMPLIILLR